MAMVRNSALCSEHQVPANHCVSLHTARTFSSGMALEIGHKVSAKLKYWNGPPYNVPEIIDAALREVREVLPLLRRSDSDNCWCDGRNPHAHLLPTRPRLAGEIGG